MSYRDNRPLDIVTVDFLGGTFVAPLITGFNVYQSPSPGSPVSSTPSDYIAAYPNGIYDDGFGQGGFGEGGFGFAPHEYTWSSAELAAGLWKFRLTTVDIAGDESPFAEFEATTVARPQPPARGTDGKRVRYTYDPNTHIATLSWQAAPYP